MTFLLLLFCCLHNETPCIGWEIQKSKNNDSSQMVKSVCASWTDHHPHTRLCNSIYFPRASPQVHEPTHPPSHQQPTCSAVLHVGGGLHTNHRRMPASHHTHTASFIQPSASFHFWLAKHGGVMWWRPIYALSGWSLFTCQIIRASCCGRSVSHEARASQWPLHRQSKH